MKQESPTTLDIGIQQQKQFIDAPKGKKMKVIFLKESYFFLSILNKLFKKIQEELKNIYDMERLHRRMALGIIVPFQFYRLDTFYQATTKIISIIIFWPGRECPESQTRPMLRQPSSGSGRILLKTRQPAAS